MNREPIIHETTDTPLDLSVTEKGVGHALLASEEQTGGGAGSSSSTLSSSLCCSFHL